MTGLYLGKRDDLTKAVESFNTLQMTEIAAAEKVVREATQKAANERLEMERARFQGRLNAMEVIRQAAEQAKQGVANADLRIKQLELEASIDDIPDSNECLNVFVPSRVLHSPDCGEAGIGGSGDREACTGAEGVNPDNPDFALITFGDQSRLMMRCRADKRILNSQLEQIEALE